MNKSLIIIAGPTASGKTDIAITLARELGTSIISADSRQIYKEMRIGTAVPTESQLEAARHYLVQHRSIHDPYDASMFENDALSAIAEVHTRHDTVILCGGTGLYIDAVCRGFDDLPSVDAEIREALQDGWKQNGLAWLQQQLAEADPDYYARVDNQNAVRMIRALEVIQITGRKFSDLRTGQPAIRPFNTLKLYLDWPREELRERIFTRTDMMMQAGMEEEARNLYPFRNLAALKTVGYKELFSYFDGEYDLDNAITKIKVNTWRYAKRQETWFRRDQGFRHVSPSEIDTLPDLIADLVSS